MASSVNMSRNENIQVFIRMKPNGSRRSSIELISDREICVRSKCGMRNLTFARVFNPSSNQDLIYETVARPLVNDILSGYSSTLFAYGQSGSGKTFTMLGEKSANNLNWEQDSHAGLIPRSINQIFDEADRTQNDVVVQISSILIYNEDLYDVLSSNEEIKLRIYDDASNKGSIVISGVENVMVRNKEEAFSCIERAFAKKEALTSSLNACSSRFHTIFTISVTVKDNGIPGDECVLFGKLCLVDLGSSDSCKSTNQETAGWDSSRVNLSLLTLGRVINSLYTHNSHIPYRESKLTRLLRDSLGGSSKTCIIACIKPFISDTDETVNTLDFMNKAKMIVNQPQIKKKGNVKDLVKKYSNEIVRLQKDLEANKTQTGLYIDEDNHREMEQKILLSIELQKKVILLEKAARKNEIERQMLCNKLDQLANESRKQSETFHSLFKQSVTQNSKILGKVDQMRAVEKANTILKNRLLRRNAANLAECKEKLKTHHNMHVQNGEQLTENVIRHTEKGSNDRSVLLNAMLNDTRETNTKILTSCQERLEKTGRDIVLSSEKINNCQSVILGNFNASKENLKVVNKEIDNIVADSNYLEHKFNEQELKLKNLEETIKSSLADVSKNMDDLKEKLKELVTTSTLETTQMIQNLFLCEMGKINSLRAENNKKLMDLGKNITTNFELNHKLQEHLNNQKTKALINDLNITGSISENEKTKIKAECAFTELIKKLDDNLEMINAFQHGYSEESKRVTEKLKKGLEEQKEKLSALSSAIETIKSQNRTGCLKLVEKEVSELTSNLATSLNEKKNVLEKTNINVETAKLKTIIDGRCKENKENIAANLTKIQQYNNFSSKQNEMIKSNLNGQIDLHNSILYGELKNYEATGETPQRQEYRFPEKLAGMSPYERNRRNLQMTIDENDLSESNISS